jgi:acyl-CoA dehydrogenase
MANNSTVSEIRIPLQPEGYSDVRSTVEKICANFPGAYWRTLERKPLGERYPNDFINALGEAGIMGALVPEAYGGPELPLEAATVIVETIHSCGCNAAMVIAQYHLTTLIIEAAGEHLKARLLPGVAEGSKNLQSLAHLEDRPEDSSAVNSSALATTTGYELTGSKSRVLAAGHSSALIVSAKISDGDDRLSLFVIDVADALRNGMRIDPLAETDQRGNRGYPL